MKLRSNSASIIALGFSLVIVTACGGGGGGDGTSNPNPVPPSDDSATPDGGTITTPITSSAPASALTGPLLFQTGNTAVQGMQENVGIGFSPPTFTYTTDTTTNTTGDGLPANNLPDIVYDDQGRGIEILTSSTAIPILIDYNDDDTIASISRTTSAGLVSQTIFTYEDGRLINKTSTSDLSDGTILDEGFISYNYSDDGTLVSADQVSFFAGITFTNTFEFSVDAMGRVIEVLIFDGGAELQDRYVINYDANGNIATVQLLRGPDGNTPFVNFTYTYAASAEPTVNLFGFLAATNDGFIPEFDLAFF